MDFGPPEDHGAGVRIRRAHAAATDPRHLSPAILTLRGPAGFSTLTLFTIKHALERTLVIKASVFLLALSAVVNPCSRTQSDAVADSVAPSAPVASSAAAATDAPPTPAGTPLSRPSIASSRAKGKNAGARTDSPITGPIIFRDPRPPKSGVCDGAAKKCTGDGETCKDNICYCKGPQFARCGTDPKIISDCRDLVSDSSNCGVCGHQCSSGTICQGGKCISGDKIKCDPGETNCPEGCRDLNEDAFACGACGHHCPDGLSCVKRRCVL